jgi:2-polyprenyl-3-methyl-5-hydroxy-6-metoxy-1,4-benzoquinol methylase
LSDIQSMYESYDDWKSWTNLFSPSSHEIDLYSKEFSAIRLLNKDFLDIGFGSGALLQWARSHGALVAGIELQEKLINAAREAGIKTFSNVSEVPDSSFDLVTAFDLLEHIQKDQLPHFLDNLFRIIRPGGVVVVRFPNCQSPAGLVTQFGDHTHVTMLSGPIVTYLMEQAGFVSVSYKGALIMRSLSMINRVIRKLLKPITFTFLFLYRIVLFDRNTPLTPNVILVAYKPNELNDGKKT